MAGEVLFPYGWEPGDPYIWLNGCDIVQDALDYGPSDWDTVVLCEYPHEGPSVVLMFGSF